MGIGNMIMFTPTLKAIRQYFVGAHITLLVGQSGCEEVVGTSGLVDEIIKVKRGFFETIKLIKLIRAEHYDLLLNTFIGEYSCLLTAFCGIPLRATHCSSPGFEHKSDFLYNIKVEMGENEHEIDRELRLAYALNAEVADDKPVLDISSDDEDFAVKFLVQHGIGDGDLLIVTQVNPMCQQPWKHWHQDRLAKVLDILVERHNAKVVLIGSPENHKELSSLLTYMKHRPVIALGKTTLKQTAAIVKRTDVIVCSDTVLMHIGAVMNRPVVAVYGPTDYRRTSPQRYNKQHIMIRKELECSPCYQLAGDDKVLSCSRRICLDMITVEDVLNHIEVLIGNRDTKKK